MGMTLEHTSQGCSEDEIMSFWPLEEVPASELSQFDLMKIVGAVHEEKKICLLPLSMFLRFLCVVACINILLHCTAEWHLFALIYHICSSAYPVDGHFVCLQF